MKKSWCILCAGAAAWILATSGSASALAAGTCSADVARLCPDITPGGGRIAACMKQRESQLSERCRAAFLETQARRRQRQVANKM